MSTTPDDDIRALVEGAVPPPGPPPMEAILERARRRGRTRRAVASSTAVVVLAIVAAGVLLAWPRSDLRFGGPLALEAAVLPLPARGDVSPEFLRDGTPVFVTHPEDGQVFVVEARSPRHVDADVLVGWCPTSRLFEEPGGGSRFDLAGHYLGGPSPTGLAPRVALVRDGDVHVGPRLAPPPRDVESPARVRSSVGDDCFEDARQQGVPGAGYVGHHLGRLGEAVSPERLAREGAHTPVLVVGTMQRIGDGPVRVCAPMPDEGQAPNVCGDAAPRLAPTSFGWFGGDDALEEGQVAAVHGAFLMTARDGVLRLRMLLPGVLEYGGWVPGTEPVEREGRLRLWRDAPPGVDGVRVQPPPLVLLLDDGTAMAVYPALDVSVSGGPVLLGLDGESSSTYARLIEVVDSGEHPDLRFRVTFSGTSGDATMIRERDL